jgi:AraC-like DNA-binding protein
MSKNNAQTAQTDWVAIARQSRFLAPRMADQMGVSLRQLERVFREDVAMSPQEWLDHAKLWQCCALLLQSKRPKEFYEDVGFKNPSGLYHAFRRYHGLSPRQYVASHVRGASPRFSRLPQIILADKNIRKSHAVHQCVLNTLSQILQKSPRLRAYCLRISIFD